MRPMIFHLASCADYWTTANDLLREFVREIIFDAMDDMRTVDRVWQKLQPPNDILATLVTRLPNLDVPYSRLQTDLYDTSLHG